MKALTAMDWLQAWEVGQSLPLPLRPCALLALLMAGGRAEAESLPVGRRDDRLLALHEALFGAQMDATVTCPDCGGQLELNLDCGTLRVDAPPSGAQHFDWHGECIAFRLPDSRDLAALSGLDPDQARLALLHRCLDTPPAAELSGEFQASLAQALAMADPQAVTELNLACPDCGHDWRELFDIGVYLDEALAQWADRLLDQVHVLAAAYGWPEGDILALNPARRAAYLSRVLA